MQYSDYTDVLHEHFVKRKAHNPRYSLRAYARDLKVLPSQLSQILNKKQGASYEVAEVMSSCLKLEGARKKWFCNSAGELHARSFKERKEYKQKLDLFKDGAKKYSEIQMEFFNVISDWYHFAILELTYHESFQSNSRWISTVLDISIEDTEKAIQRMLKLGLLQFEQGQYKDTFGYLATPEETPSSSLRNFNRQLIEKALSAMEDRPIDEREMSSSLFALDKSQLKEMKIKMREFKRNLMTEADKAKKKNSVYCLSMQLFELTRNE